jgi:hypothetical protein
MVIMPLAVPDFSLQDWGGEWNQSGNGFAGFGDHNLFTKLNPL